MNLPKRTWADCEQRQQTVSVMNSIKRLSQQFIHGLDDQRMINKILREASA